MDSPSHRCGPGAALSVLPVSPLNVFAKQEAEQTFTLSMVKSANPGARFARVIDFVLALEYAATLV
jgi:hypothetical protein